MATAFEDGFPVGHLLELRRKRGYSSCPTTDRRLRPLKLLLAANLGVVAGAAATAASAPSENKVHYTLYYHLSKGVASDSVLSKPCLELVVVV